MEKGNHSELAFCCGHGNAQEEYAMRRKRNKTMVAPGCSSKTIENVQYKKISTIVILLC